jgi:hypothetical protein
MKNEENLKCTEMIRKEGLDKFYTLPLIVDKCIKILETYHDWDKWDLIIEPSAGNGSFLTKIPSLKKIGIDILPEHPDVIKCDFFDYLPPVKKNILVFGNPPFGKISSLAIKFFNHASQWSNVIAFIIPRTFRRISVQNKLNSYFHLVIDEEIPTTPCSFYPAMTAKCCFQIWEKKYVQRQIIKLQTTHKDWDFLPFGPIDNQGQPTPPDNADFAIRAYGGKCGEIATERLHLLRPKSWHWIKANIDKDVIIDRFNKLDYSNSLNTARQNSIGKGEFVSLYINFIDSKL